MSSHPRLLTWLHWIGYAATALVAIQLVLAVVGLTYGYIEAHQRMTAFMEETRTHEEELRGGDEIQRDNLKLLALLPPLRSLGGDGFRFVAIPELARFNYAVSLSSRGGDAEGMLIVTEYPDGGAPASTTRRFTMPRAAYTALMHQIDHLTDGFEGVVAYGGCLDGTEIAFERIRAGRITSGSGNGGCYAHYREIGDAVRDALLRTVTPAGPPVGRNWYPRNGAK